MTTPAALDVILMPKNIDDLPEPTNGAYFVVDRKWLYIHRFFKFGRSLTRIKEIPSLPLNETEGFYWQNFDENPFPAEIVGKAWSFFRAVWNQRKSEAMVDITWSDDKGFRLFVPPQQASHGGVEAKRTQEHYGTSMIAGTIHSHCDFGGFHSGTDHTDAKEHDGLHITIGKVNTNKPDIAVMTSNGGSYWELKPEEVFSGPIKLVEHPSWWNTYVKDPKPSTKPPTTKPTTLAPYSQINAARYKPKSGSWHNVAAGIAVPDSFSPTKATEDDAIEACRKLAYEMKAVMAMADIDDDEAIDLITDNILDVLHPSLGWLNL